ncbi:polysaccharide export protein [Acetobacter oeni]|nr:polysaccharide biosynthesis/export family protein [Acetobacter oeni]NHO19521.1 polysaccharide export protein [Acetobacter oeni]
MACSPTHGLAPLPPATGFYRLGAGDQIRVLTYNDPQLSNTFTVGDVGTIAFPLIGAVKAAGETSQGLASELSNALSSRGLLHNPSISVEVTQYRPIFILGEVSRPGQYQYLPGMTMQSAVALAGGYTYRAIKDTASAERTEGLKENQQPVTGKIKPDTLLAPGDVVTVYERYF